VSTERAAVKHAGRKLLGETSFSVINSRMAEDMV